MQSVVAGAGETVVLGRAYCVQGGARGAQLSGEGLFPVEETEAQARGSITEQVNVRPGSTQHGPGPDPQDSPPPPGGPQVATPNLFPAH